MASEGQAGMGVNYRAQTACVVQQASVASKRLRSLVGSGPHPGEGGDAWIRTGCTERGSNQADTQIAFIGGGWGTGGWAPSPHCTACSLALLPESCGFITSGSSGGLEKGSMRRASNASSGEEKGKAGGDGCL